MRGLCSGDGSACLPGPRPHPRTGCFPFGVDGITWKRTRQGEEGGEARQLGLILPHLVWAPPQPLPLCCQPPGLPACLSSRCFPFSKTSFCTFENLRSSIQAFIFQCFSRPLLCFLCLFSILSSFLLSLCTSPGESFHAGRSLHCICFTPVHTHSLQAAAGSVALWPQ